MHEAYIRLAKIEQFDLNNKQHMMRLTVGMMRRVLIDYARKHNAKKRNPEQLFLRCPVVGFKDHVEAEPGIDLLALDEALKNLRRFDERKADIVELRYFGGESCGVAGDFSSDSQTRLGSCKSVDASRA